MNETAPERIDVEACRECDDAGCAACDGEIRDRRRLSILQHSLGLDEYGRGREYRNHYVSGPGCTDYETCRALMEAGLMQDHGTGALYGGSHCFTVTDAGRRYVREHSPAPPKMTASQRRYERYLDADCGLSFGEWLALAPQEEPEDVGQTEADLAYQAGLETGYQQARKDHRREAEW